MIYSMTIYSLYIISKSGGLIYNYDNNAPKVEVEKTFTYPLPLRLEDQNKKIVVVFGQRDGIKVGHIVLSINGVAANGTQLEDGRDIMELIQNKDSYPLSIRFGRPKMSTNEKIFLASMFYPLYAIATQLSPVPKSSGIEVLEADVFTLHCLQTVTGVKFLVVSEPRATGMDTLLHKMYELYSDYALKNPFYSLEMPIRCDLFDQHLLHTLEHSDKLTI